MHAEYEERYVAYIDILGFRSLTHRVTGDPDLFKKIVELFNEAKTYHERGYLERECPGTVLSTFSDTIVISCPTEANGLMMMFWAILTFFDGIISRSGLLLRGAISKGEFYHSEHMYFGPALNEAYDSENTVAVNPRIILSREVFDDSQHYLNNSDLRNRALWFGKMVLRDPVDGVPFLHLLLHIDPTYQEMGSRMGQPTPEYVKDLIVSTMESLIDSPSAYRKWNWFQQYYQQTMSEQIHA